MQNNIHTNNTLASTNSYTVKFKRSVVASNLTFLVSGVIITGLMSLGTSELLSYLTLASMGLLGFAYGGLMLFLYVINLASAILSIIMNAKYLPTLFSSRVPKTLLRILIILINIIVNFGLIIVIQKVGEMLST